MKALIFEEYDSGDGCYDHWITNVYLVPDDFDYNKELLNYIQNNTKNLPKKKDGSIYFRDSNRYLKQYTQEFKTRFHEIKFEIKD